MSIIVVVVFSLSTSTADAKTSKAKSTMYFIGLYSNIPTSLKYIGQIPTALTKTTKEGEFWRKS